jgi:hypothetical protein
MRKQKAEQCEFTFTRDTSGAVLEFPTKGYFAWSIHYSIGRKKFTTTAYTAAQRTWAEMACEFEVRYPGTKVDKHRIKLLGKV